MPFKQLPALVSMSLCVDQHTCIDKGQVSDGLGEGLLDGDAGRLGISRLFLLNWGALDSDVHIHESDTRSRHGKLQFDLFFLSA